MTRPGWSDVPAVVIASGPSLSDEQLEHVQSVRWDREACRVIAVNNTCSRVPWADCAYFGDYLALKCYVPKLRPPAGDFQGEWWTQDKAGAERWGLNYVKSANRPGLGAQRVHLNGNSGFQAINLATLFGATKVILVAFDMQPGPAGELHHFGSHPAPLVQTCLFDEWMHKAKAIAEDAQKRGIDIVNCSARTAMTAFRRADLTKELQC
jgi:hypothetical protein